MAVDPTIAINSEAWYLVCGTEVAIDENGNEISSPLLEAYRLLQEIKGNMPVDEFDTVGSNVLTHAIIHPATPTFTVLYASEINDDYDTEV